MCTPVSVDRDTVLYGFTRESPAFCEETPLTTLLCLFFLVNHNLKKDPYVQTTKKTPRSGKATGTNRGECTPPPSNSGRGPDSGTEAESCGISPLPRVVCSKTVTMVL